MGTATNRVARTVCAAVLVLTMTAAGATASSAGATDDGPVLCDGTLQGEVVGDVRVPTEISCTVSTAEITGDLLVDRGATVRLQRSTVHGAVVSAGWVDVRESTVHGRTWLDDVGIMQAAHSTFSSPIRGEAQLVSLVNVTLGGSLNVGGTHTTTLRRVDVDGWINVPSRSYGPTTLSTVTARGLTLKAGGGVTLCDVALEEHLIVRNHDRVHVGLPLYTVNSCPLHPEAFKVTVGGSARFEGNTQVLLHGIDAAEHLVCVDNADVDLSSGSLGGRPLVTAGLGRLGQCR
ncbi:hypothetical protein [Cellulomonas oligotrophica]|uniref:Lipoprotein n=1 Tax=Cellulomonas oligotrophica TaxID=931536 RepID=A0A7Y9FFE4_9CELL|nr:hypothetical protein [Cellulomonas oligotrophica]NYD86234.1 hypothetical protein [Cellulomonas oligotrophica]GIG34439.1 hypothetical protein Col01nite_35980 [Cellulomonas oligotrophica]